MIKHTVGGLFMRSSVLSTLGLLIAVVVTPVLSYGNSLPVVQGPPDYNGSYLSQYDTINQYTLGQVYDNFSLNSTSEIDSVEWWGNYGSATPTPISSFTISFYYAVSPDGSNHLATSQTIAAASTNETSTGVTDVNGYNTFVYNADIAPVDLYSGSYWVSVVANMVVNYDSGYAPINTWSWETSSLGDAKSYQDSLGFRTQLSTDFAFVLSGGAPGPNFLVPEPGTIGLVGFGMLTMGGMSLVRRRKSAGI